ncbi:MAG: enoyl-CoA hydratase [Ramlibacter sp.]|nr:enoyl-CoA hydratase [Ramlibacter sp.]
MDNEFIRITCDDGIATAAFNDPEHLNPLSPQMQQGLAGIIERVRADTSIRALVLTGEGRAFCSGADLATINAGPMSPAARGDQVADAMVRVTQPFILGLRELPVPIVSAVNGPAAGAGVGIALAADIVLAARSSYFYLPFLTRLGVVPDLGTTWFLERALGRARALRICLMHDRISAEEAAAWGLVAECVNDGDLMGRAMQAARQLARLPAHAALEARRAIDAAASNTLAAQLDYECARQRELVGRAEFTEGVNAFAEKRAPVFPARSQAGLD